MSKYDEIYKIEKPLLKYGISSIDYYSQTDDKIRYYIVEFTLNGTKMDELGADFLTIKAIITENIKAKLVSFYIDNIYNDGYIKYMGKLLFND